MARSYEDVIRLEDTTAALPGKIRAGADGFENNLLRRMLHVPATGPALHFTPDETLAGQPRVSVDADDTTPGNLAAKLLAGSGIASSIQNPAGNETLTFAADFGTGAGKICQGNDPRLNPSGVLGISIGGSLIPIAAGLKGYLQVPFNCSMASWSILADVVGSTVIDVWKTPFAGFPPLVANSITGSAIPTLSGAQSAASAILTGWTLTITAGDVLAFNVNSAATVTKLVFELHILRI